MKWFWGFLSIITMSTSGAVATGYAAIDLVENVKNATVLITTYNKDGYLIGRGSGFYVDEGIVITNIHVIDGTGHYYRVYTKGEDDSIDTSCYRTIDRSSIKLNLEDDIAYLRAYVECPHTSVFFSDTDPEVGEEIGIYGYPAFGDTTGTLDLYYFDGKVLEKDVYDEIGGKPVGPWIYTDAVIHGGNSGGPVVQDGKVVGIAVAAYLDAQGNSVDGLFIPVSQIRRGLEYANDSSFGYTPQDMQSNTIYSAFEEQERRSGPQDPFNPIPASSDIPSNADCRASLGEGGEATGFSAQQGDGCRCKSSYHVNDEGTGCAPGSPDYAARLREAEERTADTEEEPGTTSNDNSDDSRNAFADVTTRHPYFAAIEWAKQQRVLQGYADGNFRPNRTVNRAEFLKIILEASGEDLTTNIVTSGFDDVDERAWYAPYIRYAKENGIIQGYADGTFRPDQTVNIAEALKITYGVLRVSTEEDGLEWYDRFLNHAKTNDVLFQKRVNPAGAMTRKDTVWVVWRLLQ